MGCPIRATLYAGAVSRRQERAAYGLQHQARTAVLGPMLVVIVVAPFVNLSRLVQFEHPADRKLEREAAAIPVPAVEPLRHHLVAEAEEVEQLELNLFCRRDDRADHFGNILAPADLLQRSIEIAH